MLVLCSLDVAPVHAPLRSPVRRLQPTCGIGTPAQFRKPGNASDRAIEWHQSKTAIGHPPRAALGLSLTASSRETAPSLYGPPKDSERPPNRLLAVARKGTQ